MPRVVEVIEYDELKGDGASTPKRRIKTIHTLEGELIALYDEYAIQEVKKLMEVLMQDCREEKLLELIEYVHKLINE